MCDFLKPINHIFFLKPYMWPTYSFRGPWMANTDPMLWNGLKFTQVFWVFQVSTLLFSKYHHESILLLTFNIMSTFIKVTVYYLCGTVIWCKMWKSRHYRCFYLKNMFKSLKLEIGMSEYWGEGSFGKSTRNIFRIKFKICVILHCTRQRKISTIDRSGPGSIILKVLNLALTVLWGMETHSQPHKQSQAQSMKHHSQKAFTESF